MMSSSPPVYNSQPKPIKRASISVGDSDSEDATLTGSVSLSKKLKTERMESADQELEKVNCRWKSAGEDRAKEEIKLVSQDGLVFVLPQYWLQAGRWVMLFDWDPLMNSTRLRILLSGEPDDEMAKLLGVDITIELENTPKCLHLDTLSSTLANYLCLLQDISPTIPYTLPELKQVSLLAKSLKSPGVTSAVSIILRDVHAHHSPWATFSVAAAINDVPAAKSSLANMGKDRKYRDFDLGNLRPAMVSTLNNIWLCALVRACQPHTGRVRNGSGRSQMNWMGISEDFDVD